MRTVWPISVSPLNPDAIIVAQALKEAPKGERSALLLRWAAAYLQGRVDDQPIVIPEFGMTDDELSDLLDGF